MEFRRLDIPEVILVEPNVIHDARGFFLETYHRDKYAAGGIPETFVQDNQSFSRKGVLRGLHAQLQHPQGKLVRAIIGEIFDVAVDIRPGSPTFGRWVGAVLTEGNAQQLYVPPGFAHGFCVLSDIAHVQYKCTDVYHPGDEIGVVWNDPEIGIDWPVGDPVLNDKDRNAPRLAEIVQRLRSV
ncbi:MAG TPA: dTDP-4-dehydrorhamnose 3,5-epimerase [Thermoanaerobaculia bacterium]|nr:dTDP-4-dehydrorhamnose 3,5-epimerase [Thermoanaerobaculia bacterium]